MKKILILGGDGMLGHKAYQILSRDFDTFATVINFHDKLRQIKIFDDKRIFNKVDAFNFNLIEKIIIELRPDFIINCIGIIKQLKESKNPKISIYINSLLPHLLAECCKKTDSKLIHISTDCVFSGKKGNYVEEDLSDAEDLYGKTKYLGEINYGTTLTLRTSIIGQELFTSHALFEWFLSQKNKSVNGYVNAIYTGLTTIAFCNEIKRIINEYPKLAGLYHVSSEKIDKFQLLCLIRDTYKLNIKVRKYYDFYCDRSLDSTRYRRKTKFVPPSWKKMIKEMFLDSTQYNKRRKK